MKSSEAWSITGAISLLRALQITVGRWSAVSMSGFMHMHMYILASFPGLPCFCMCSVHVKCVCEGNNGKRPGTISHVRWTAGRHMEGASRVQDQCSH